MDYLSLWKNALTKPKETFPIEKANASISEGAKHIAIGSGIAGLLIGLVLAFLGSLLTAVPGAGVLGALGLASIVVVPIGAIVATLVLSLISTGVMHVIAKLLGGTGSYKELFYITAIFTAPLQLLQVILLVIPFLGQLISLLLSLYSLYLLVQALKAVHILSTGRAIGVLVIHTVLILVLAFALVFALTATLLAAGASSGVPLAAGA